VCHRPSADPFGTVYGAAIGPRSAALEGTLSPRGDGLTGILVEAKGSQWAIHPRCFCVHLAVGIAIFA
jgi:hypothetical protein